MTQELIGKKMQQVICYDCFNFCHDSSVDCPYPSYWCRKDHWDGIEDTDDLFELIDCHDFEEKT